MTATRLRSAQLIFPTRIKHEPRPHDGPSLVFVSILQDALRTLDYLFPPGHPATAKYLHRKRIWQYEDVRPGVTRPHLRKIDYYHDRMVELANEYINPPKTLSSAMRDRRNPIQFYTFWFGTLITLATIIFGIVQSVMAGFSYGIARYPPSSSSP